MGIEIERKFLVRNDSWRDHADEGTSYEQGYLCDGGNCSIRVRIEGDQARLNIKSATLGIVRQEFEYPIPLAEARELLDRFCPATVRKTRYHVEHAGKTWEIDVFEQDNAGLIVTEVELEREDEEIDLPDWVGDEVSSEPRYYNTELARHPYRQWA